MSASMARSATPPRPRRPLRAAAHVVKLRDLDPARHRRADGAARRGRQTTIAASGRYTLLRRQRRRRSGQKHELASVLGVPPEQVRVVSGDVGGNFGTRNAFYPGIRAGRLGGATDRPAGQMDLRAQRGLSQRLSGARSRRRAPNWRSMATARFLALRGSQHRQCRRAYALSFVPLHKGVSRSCRASTTSRQRACARAPR